MRSCEVLAAGTLVLVLSQLHAGIIIFATTMAGARTDAPLILAIESACGRTSVPPVWSHVRDEPNPTACGPVANVTTSATRGKPFLLFVNDQAVGRQESRSPIVQFSNVRLRPGLNRLVVLEEDARVPYPHLTRGRLDEERSLGSRRRIGWFWVPYFRAPHSVSIVWNPEPSTGRPSVAPQAPAPALPAYGPFASEHSNWWLDQGLPGTLTSRRTHSASHLMRFGSDGLLIDHSLPGPARQAGDATVPIRRHLTIRADDEDRIALELSACLPPEHPFVSWVRLDQIDAPELITRLTGYYLSQDPISVSDDRWRQPSRVESTDEPNQPCVRLKASYQLAGSLERTWSPTTFLALPNDELVLDRSLTRAFQSTPAADMVRDQSQIWRWKHTPAMARPPAFKRYGVSAAAATMDRTAPPPDPVEGRTAHRSSAFASWQDLSAALPAMIRSTLWSLAYLLPVALIYWAMGRGPANLQTAQARAGVRALLVFLGALALHPVLVEFSRALFDIVGLWSFVVDEARFDFNYSIPVVPIAFIATLMTTPLLRADTVLDDPTSGWVRRAGLAVLAIGFASVAVGIAALERWVIGGLQPSDLRELADEIDVLHDFIAHRGIALLLTILLLIWCVVGFVAYWLSLYWLARSVLPRARLAGMVSGAAMVMLLLPALTPMLESGRMLLAAAVDDLRPYGAAATILSALAVITTFVAETVMVTIVLWAFREIAASMLPPESVTRFRSWTRKTVLLIIAVLLVGPSLSALSPGDDANTQVYRIMTVLQAYGGLLALLAPLLALRLVDARNRDASLATRFDIDRPTVLLMTAAFAGYLSLWTPAPIGAPILVAIGWLVFTYGVVGPSPPTDGAAEPGLAQRILAYRSDMRLLETRRKTYEKQFTEGAIDAAVLSGQRTTIEAERSRVRNALGMSVEDAKCRLLSFGPEASPLRNGVIGASIGLAAAVLLQIVLPIDFRPDTSGKASVWASLLQMFIVDPSYRPAVSAEKVSKLLALISEVLNAVTIWVLLGFLFGFMFHRIRGQDGFAKAIVFGLCIAVTFLVGQALIARSTGVPITNLARLVPIFVFLILLGTLVFDGTTLRRQGVPLARLPDLYGMRTSVGYASLTGAVAGVPALLQLLDWAFGRG